MGDGGNAEEHVAATDTGRLPIKIKFGQLLSALADPSTCPANAPAPQWAQHWNDITQPYASWSPQMGIG